MKLLSALTGILILLLPAAAAAHSLREDTHWSGNVKIEGQLVVEPGITLTVEPGTAVSFLPGKLDEEGLADSGLLVKGTIVADGLPESRITFTSGAIRQAPGDWGEIKLFGSKGSSFRNCDFSYGGWGLHVHETDLKIEGCTFTRNSYGGVRLKGGEVEITGCTMKGMEIGVRYWKGAPSIHHNEISGNKTGIFCRQECAGSSINFNNIYGNSEYDIKLGDAQKEDVDASRNWWGNAGPKIYDHEREGYIGSVLVEPALKDKVRMESLPFLKER